MHPRRAVLFTLLLLMIGLLLLDNHGSVHRIVNDVRATWFDLHPADSTADSTAKPNG
jgi:hypothetical protein